MTDGGYTAAAVGQTAVYVSAIALVAATIMYSPTRHHLPLNGRSHLLECDHAPQRTALPPATDPAQPAGLDQTLAPPPRQSTAAARPPRACRAGRANRPWFAQASAARRAELRQAIKQRTTSHQALAKALQGLRGITEFCEPLLQARLGIQVALTQAQFRHQPFTSSLGGEFPDPDASHHVPRTPASIEEPAGTASLTSLLEAALHNFEGMTEVGPFSTLQVSVDDSRALPGLSTTAFVTHCRALDLGRRYQEHLQDIYGGQREALLRALWGQARRDELTVQALIARMRGLLTDDGLQSLQQLCSTGSIPCYRGAPAKVAVLRMLDIQLHDLLLLTSTRQSTPSCIAYLPFDDAQPVQEFNNLLAFGRYLRRRLLEPAYRERFWSMSP